MFSQAFLRLRRQDTVRLAGMPFNAAAFQGAPPPSFGSGEWMHHADMGLGQGANAVTPARADHTAGCAAAGVTNDCADGRFRGLAFADPYRAAIGAASVFAVL